MDKNVKRIIFLGVFQHRASGEGKTHSTWKKPALAQQANNARLMFDIKDLQRGDENAWSSCYGELHKIALHAVYNTPPCIYLEDPEFIATQAILKLIPRIDRLPNEAALRSYLWKTASRMKKDYARHIRAQKCDVRRTVNIESQPMEPGLAVQPAQVAFEICEALEVHMKAIKPKNEKMFRALCIQEREVSEVALSYGITIATAKKRANRGAKELKQHILRTEPELLFLLKQLANIRC